MLLKYSGFFIHCATVGTQLSAHRSANMGKSLKTPVFLTRQFIHFPITGQEKIIITQLCHETVTDKFDTYFQ